ncbi:MAG: glycosyltransferase family 4 protein [Candidatus Altiarchaeota archaeon]|nr:glycosyltransferase family 4 protein [Candidatus Altiarchaeota archaeon]
MRILFIHDNHKHLGGAETYLFQLMKLLKGRGHSVYFFSIDKNVEARTEDIFVYKEKRKNRLAKHLSYYYLDWGIYKALKNWIKEIKPDVIHLQNIQKCPITLLLAATSSGIPVVYTVHDVGILCLTGLCIKPSGEVCGGGFGVKCVWSGCVSLKGYLYNFLPKIIKKYLIKNRIKLIISPSRAFEKLLGDDGYANVAHIKNFIDIQNCDVDQTKIERGNVLFVGMLEQHKGVYPLMNAFSSVSNKIPSAVLHIVGEGREKEGMTKKANELGFLEKVVFHGKIPKEELATFYQKANLVVFPSVCMENSPYVIREAMASGRPVVASNIGGIPELVVEGETGFLVSVRNPDELTEKILRLLSDWNLAKKMGENARRIAEKDLKANDHLDKILEVYTSLSEK